MPLQVGQIIAGKYRVDRLIGSGAMGAVFAATHLVLHKPVALKVLTSDLTDSAEAGERFLREGVAASRVSHRAIVEVFDAGTHDGSPWMAMQLLVGESLEDLIARRRRLMPESAVGIAVEVLGALDLVHRAGIVHRDLKPANIFLERHADGVIQPKILDFGIAKFAPSVTGQPTSGITNLTLDGVMVGTGSYLSPEQIRGLPDIDGRADVYAIGVVLFEVLSGACPHSADTLMDLVAKVLRDPAPDIRTLAPHVPERLALAIGEALATDRTARPQNAASFASRLQEALGIGPGEVSRRLRFASTPPPAPEAGSSSGTPAHRAPGRHPHAGRAQAQWLAVGVGLAAVAGVLLLRAENPTPSDPASGERAPRTRDAAPEAAQTPIPTPALPATAQNRWVRVAPPTSGKPVILGVRDEHDPQPGFRPSRLVTAPTTPFSIQEHEVTWREFVEWSRASRDIQPPVDKSAFPSASAREPNLPATGIPWTTAEIYCFSLGAALPTEEQWEYAARGGELRPHPWGSDTANATVRMHALVDSDNVRPRPVMSGDDRTPGNPSIYDLAGNAREWTADLYRADRAGGDESWVTAAGREFRAVRGLPLSARNPDAPTAMPNSTAAFRSTLCAAGACPADTLGLLRDIGFRCARVESN